MPILNYTTHISVEKTLAVIHKLLVGHGARAVLYEYDAGRDVTAVKFQLILDGRELPYRLPADVPAVLTLLQRDRQVPRRYKTPEQARRIAWRVIKDWLEAQLAFVSMRQVSVDQIMLPYLLLPDGQTVYERVKRSQYQLPPAREG
jgi:hypothetical protein